jgi:lipoyl(octanoyl) transferase
LSGVCEDCGVTVDDELWVCHLGLVEYRHADALQDRIRAARQAEAIPDTLLLLEHNPVYTKGRRSSPGELGMGEDWYRMQGIDIVDTDRGGFVTYHGPGQLVGYPIMRVTDVSKFVLTMERAIIAALAEEGIAARDRCAEGAAFTGVWVGERKIASIGVHVSRGVTKHGFAVNVDNDMQPFEYIVPCRLDGVRMTSITAETRTGDHLPAFRERMAARFAEGFDRQARTVDVPELHAAATASV